MTSDRGLNSEETELIDKKNTPVTPPTPGLNPNANIFQCGSKPSSPTPCQDDSYDASNENVNDDLGKLAYPPSLESPDGLLGGNGAGSSDSGYLASPTEPASSIDENSSVEDASEGVDDEMRAVLKNQLEFYFSRENLAVDSYLVSQMNGDQYVPIAIIASFNQVKKLTNDLDLIVQVLRESSNVQVDEQGVKVRPLHKRCIVILREIPDSTPLLEVERLFSGKNCPKFSSCEFAHNNCWNVTFETEEDAQRAYQYLREEVQTFHGHPIMARIKAKPIVLSTYTPKNGYNKAPQPHISPGPFDPTPFSHARFPTPTFTPQVPAANLHFLNTNQSFPFYPPGLLQTPWPTSLVPPNSAPPYFDAGMAFAVNGFHPQALKYNNIQGRINYNNQRARVSTSKIHNRTLSNPEGMMHARHNGVLANGMRSPRTSDYPTDHAIMNGQSEAPHNSMVLGQSGHGHHYSHNNHNNHRQSMDNIPPRYLRNREIASRLRRKREEDGASTVSEPLPPTPSPVNEDFELDAGAFPALPGATESMTTGEVFENKLSDVVKGTAKLTTKSPSPQQTHHPKQETNSMANSSAANRVNNNHITRNNNMKNEANQKLIEKDNNRISKLYTPPHSPTKVNKSTSMSDVSKSPKCTDSPPLPNGSVSPLSDHSDTVLQPAKLSYAQMALMARERAVKEAATKITEVKDVDPEVNEDTAADKENNDNVKCNGKMHSANGTHRCDVKDTDAKDQRSYNNGRWFKDGRRSDRKQRDFYHDKRTGITPR